MKGLLIKDFYIIKHQLIYLIIGVIVMALAAQYFIPSDSTVVIVVSILLITSLVVTSSSEDATSKWNRLEITMPVTRQEVVLSKYIIYLILGLVAIVVAVIPLIIVGLIKNNIDVNTILIQGIVFIAYPLIVGCLTLPCLYILPIEKAQVTTMVAFFIALGILYAFGSMVELIIPGEGFLNIRRVIISLFSVLMFYISYILTSKAYAKKDV